MPGGLLAGPVGTRSPAVRTSWPGRVPGPGTMTRHRAGHWWPFHGPAAGLRLTGRFGAAPYVRVKYPCDQRIREARVTLRWRGSRQRGDRPRIPTLLYVLQRRSRSPADGRAYAL